MDLRRTTQLAQHSAAKSEVINDAVAAVAAAVACADLVVLGFNLTWREGVSGEGVFKVWIAVHAAGWGHNERRILA